MPTYSNRGSVSKPPFIHTYTHSSFPKPLPMHKRHLWSFADSWNESPSYSAESGGRTCFTMPDVIEKEQYMP
jgi:hypothetical protein